MFFLAFYSTLFVYMYLRSLQALILMLIPVPFILLSRDRYNGGIDISYETEFNIMLSLVSIQIVIWFVSLFFKARSISDNIKKEEKHLDNLSVCASIESAHQETVNIMINKIDDCFYIAELIGCDGSINFTEQYLEYLETEKITTQSYLAVCTYVKFGECHQNKETYSVTIQCVHT